MGKRKRISDQTQKDCSPSTNEAMPCSSDLELLADEKPSHLGDAGALAPVLDITDGSVKLPNSHPTTTHHHHHHQNLGRSIFLKRSRHYYGHQYSRRNSANHGNASSSRGKGTCFYDEKPSFKLTSQANSEPRRHLEYRERAFSQPERIRSSSLVMDAVSPDAGKKVCGICEKPLKRKLFFLGSSMSSNDLSVVAILVCGHVYHADCLEQRSSFEERRDPSCPLCAGLVLQVDDSKKDRNSFRIDEL